MKTNAVKNQARQSERDPACCMRVDSDPGGLVLNHRGRSYHFCAEPCRRSFEKNPEKYLRPKGPLGRFLRRLANANEKAFGPKGPSCCQ